MGQRARGVISSEGYKQCYRIRRMKCPECKSIHHELPDFMVPYKRYTVQTVEAAIEGETDWMPCNDGTTLNFKHWFASIAGKMVCLLEKALCKSENEYATVSPLQRIKRLYGDSRGWLSWAIQLTIREIPWKTLTRLPC